MIASLSPSTTKRTLASTRAACVALVASLVLAVGCGNNEKNNQNNTTSDMSMTDMRADMTPADMGADDGGQMTTVGMRFDPAGAEFFDVPFPSDTRVKPDGTLDLLSWEKAKRYDVLENWLIAAEEVLRGWGLVSGVFTYYTTPLDPATLPADAAASIKTDGGLPSVFLMNVQPGSPDAGELLPIECTFRPEVGTLRPENQLACKQPWGVVRRENTRYAFVVTDAVKTADGEALQVPPSLQKLMAGEAVPGRYDAMVSPDAYTESLKIIEAAGVPAARIRGLTVFTTGEPTKRLLQIAEFYKSLPDPKLDEAKGITMTQVYDEYVVLEAFYDVPIIQTGDFPYDKPPAGKIKFKDDGTPEIVDTQSIRVFITIPRETTPQGGLPVLFWLHGSGGRGDDLITRGPQPDKDTAAPAGSGPAHVVARYGVAGFGADFQFHGTRFDPPDTSGLKLYNLIQNPRATIDNFIVAANEVTLHTRLMKHLAIDPASVTIAVTNGMITEEDARQVLLNAADMDGKIHFNADRFSALGQSMGSTIGLPALTIDPELDAGIMSGSGGVLIEIATNSKKPVDVNGLLRLILRYKPGEKLDQYDPALHALQHLWDYVDPTIHARHAFRHPHPGIPAKHILQHSGVSDGYFTASSKAAFGLATGVEPVAPVEEQEVVDHMIWGGRTTVRMPPVSANTPEGVTGIQAQYQPSVLDGHNVAYQVQGAMDQYGCFAASLGMGGAPTFYSVANSTPALCPATNP